VSGRPARLIAVEGVNGRAVLETARRALVGSGGARGGISQWDASGLFEQLLVAETEAGRASARTLLLLYAADLAFRLRWEIEPILAEGKTVVAAPYVETGIAVGRAVGLASGWLANLFRFARPAADRHYVTVAASSSITEPQGFVEFAGLQLSERIPGLTRRQIAARAREHLSRAAGRDRAPVAASVVLH
jgi:hypothetical protein